MHRSEVARRQLMIDIATRGEALAPRIDRTQEKDCMSLITLSVIYVSDRSHVYVGFGSLKGLFCHFISVLIERFINLFT